MPLPLQLYPPNSAVTARHTVMRQCYRRRVAPPAPPPSPTYAQWHGGATIAASHHPPLCCIPLSLCFTPTAAESELGRSNSTMGQTVHSGVARWRFHTTSREEDLLHKKIIMLEPDGQEHKAHMNTRKLISFGAAQLDNFFRVYCFVYIDILQGT
jgi:hypothetical protein